MILTEHFVFIHQPKTGGTFVSAMLEQLFAPRNRLLSFAAGFRRRRSFVDTHAHETCAEIPESHRGKPIIATIRNPLDRYVSQYEFPWWKTQNNDVIDADALRERFPHFPELTFPEFLMVIHRVLGVRQSDNPTRHPYVGFQTVQFVRFFCRDAEHFLTELNDDCIDTGTYREHLYPIHFLRTDRLNEDLHRYLQSLSGLPRDPSFILDARKVLPANSSRTEAQDWRSYYDRESFDRVRHDDRMLFDLFPAFDDGWRPGSASS